MSAHNVKVKAIATANSRNEKIGSGLGSVYFDLDESCPLKCPLRENGCYARNGSRIYLLKSKFKPMTAKEIIDIASKTKSGIVRLSVSGDLYKSDGVTFNSEFFEDLIEEISKHPSIKFYIYTRAIKELEPYKDRIPKNLKIIISIPDEDNPQLEDYINNDLGFVYAKVVEDVSKYNLKHNEVYCPIDYAKVVHGMHMRSIRTTCSRCRLCIDSNKKINIVFPKTGHKKRHRYIN